MISRANSIYEKTCTALVIGLVGIYILQNISVSYWIVPGLWLVIILLMWLKLPAIHGMTKLKHRGTVWIWAFNCGVIMMMINLGAGMIEGFGRSPYSHSLKGILTNVVFIVPALVGREWIRSYFINTYGKRQTMRSVYGIVLLMTLFELNMGKVIDITTLKQLTIFLAEQLIPILCKNILATYLVLYGGPVASIIYLGMGEAFEWLSPILPNIDWLAKGVVGMVVPIGCLVFLMSNYGKLTKQVKAYRIKEESSWQWAPTALISVLLIWFTVGVFPVYPSAIATGSMQPMIDPGDVVLVKKVQKMEDIEALKIGDVIQFRRDAILINHRIVDVLEEDGVTVYQTKGDNNSSIDIRLVKREEVKGTIVGVIPKIGWPTLVFKSDNPESLKDIEF